MFSYYQNVWKIMSSPWSAFPSSVPGLCRSALRALVFAQHWHLMISSITYCTPQTLRTCLPKMFPLILQYFGVGMLSSVLRGRGHWRSGHMKCVNLSSDGFSPLHLCSTGISWGTNCLELGERHTVKKETGTSHKEKKNINSTPLNLKNVIQITLKLFCGFVAVLTSLYITESSPTHCSLNKGIY